MPYTPGSRPVTPPAYKLLMKDGRYVDDLSIGTIADFLVGFV